MTECGRTVETFQAMESLLRENFSDCDVRRSYAPRVDLEDLEEAEHPTLFVILDDVTVVDESSNGLRWKEIYTFTVAVCKKILDVANPTPEVDAMVYLVETMRDAFRWTKHGVGDDIVITAAEHVPNRPLYVQDELEENDLFVGCVVLEVVISGRRNRDGGENDSGTGESDHREGDSDGEVGGIGTDEGNDWAGSLYSSDDSEAVS